MNRCARCNWRPEDDETLDEHAEAASHPLCTSCTASLPSDRPRVCRDCQDANGERLQDVLSMWRELPDHLAAHASEPLPGGNVLVLAGPGARGEQGADDPERRKLILDNEMTDLPSVAWTLISWADDWRDVRGDQHPDRDAVTADAQLIEAAHGYLTEHGSWAAAQHWAWAEYAADIKKLHGALLVATGRHRAATRLGLRCFACRGQLVYRIVRDQDAEPAPSRPRWWVAKEVLGPVDDAEYARRHLNNAGLEEDDASCRDCGLRYTVAALLLAQRAAVEDAQWYVDDDGERWGTVKAVADYVNRSHWSLRAWRREGIVRSSTGIAGLHLNLHDVETVAAERPAREPKQAS